MVRVLLFFLVSSLCFSANLDLNLKNLLGDKVYEQNSGKLRTLFSNEAMFLDENSNPNYDKITNLLRTNSILSLNYSSPAYMDLTFKSTSSTILFLKVITQSLNNLGYNYFLTKNFSTQNSQISWLVIINTQFILNPGNLYKELKQNNVYIKGIHKTGTFSYTYDIDMSRAILKTLPYESDTTVELSKPLEPYFLNINGKKNIEIMANPADNWISLVKIYDRNLKLISQIKSDIKEKSLNIEFPDDAFYILIDDAFSLENIKRGLKIYIKS